MVLNHCEDPSDKHHSLIVIIAETELFIFHLFLISLKMTIIGYILLTGGCSAQRIRSDVDKVSAEEYC